MMAAQGLNQLLAFVWMAVMARWLSQYDFGLFSIAAATTALAAPIADPGVSGLSIRESAAHPERIRNLIANALALRGLLSLLAIGVTGAMSFISGYDKSEMLIIALFSTTLLTDSGRSIASIAFRATQKLSHEAIALLVFRFATLAGSAFIIFAGYGLLGAVLIYCIAGVISSALALLMVVRMGVIPDWRAVSIREQWGLLKESLPLGIALFLSQIYFRIDALLLAKLSDLQHVALYSAAYRITEALRTLQLPAMHALFPVLAKTAGFAPRDSVRLTVRTMASLLALWVPVALTLLALSGPATVLLYGNTYAEAALPLSLLSLALPLFVANGLLNYLLLSLGMQSHLLINALILVCVNIGLNLWLVPLFGTEGAAMATALTEVCLVGLNLMWLARHRLLELRNCLPCAGVLGIGGVSGILLMLVIPDLTMRLALIAVSSGLLILTSGLHENLRRRSSMIPSLSE
jgi:O-antigen/teichoic acid export membrane protein